MLLLWKGVLEGWNEKDRMREERRQENGGTGQAENGFPCWLREMDFLNIPARRCRPDATASNSQSGLIAGFW